MKFDLIVGNPPYDGSGKPLYLRILAHLIPYSKELVWICPTQWAKAWKDIPYTAELKKTTLNCLIEHENIPSPFEDAAICQGVGIYHFVPRMSIVETDKYEDSNGPNHEDYEDLRYEKFKNVELAKSIISKLEAHESIDEHIWKGEGNYYVNFSDMRGNGQSGMDSWFWYTLMNDELRHNFNKVEDPKVRKRISFAFNTEEECKNFVSAIESDISTFALYVTKSIKAIIPSTLSLIPWLSDYTRSWTDEDIAKELGFTKEELEYIHEEMKNFGWKCAKKVKK